MKILFYYHGFLNTDKHLAGTNRMLLSVAQIFGNYGNVTIASNSLERDEVFNGINIVKVNVFKRVELSVFDIVVFICGKDAVKLQKPPRQKWVRYQHCWHFHNDEYTEKYDMVVGVSKIHADYMVACGIPEKKVTFINNFINLDKFYKRDIERDEYSIMYCGAISKNKNVDLMIEAIKSSFVLSQSLHIDVYGDCEMTGSPREYYDKVVKMSEGMNITFHGPVGKEELAMAYSRNSAICLPSDVESFGLVLAEAQACGCVPIAHGSGGVSFTVNDKCGILYNPNAIYELYNAINYAFAVGFKDEDREHCIRYARRNFTVKKAMKQIPEIIDRLVG